MSKKLLASLMAGVMLFSQGTSLGAVKPNQGGFSGFWKSNKSFILGGVSLAGLTAGVAYLIHTHNVPRVEGMECPKNFENSKIQEDFLNNVSKCLNEGKTVKITSIEKDPDVVELSNFVFNYISEKDRTKHIDYKLIIKDINEIDDRKGKDSITISQIKYPNNKFELRYVVERDKEDNSSSKGNNSVAKSFEAEPSSVSLNDYNSANFESSISSKPEFEPEEIEARVFRGNVEGEKIKGLNNICEFFKTSSLNLSSVIIDKCSRDNVENIAESIANAVDYDRSIVYRYNENTSNNTQKLQVSISRDTSGNISYVCAYFGYN